MSKFFPFSRTHLLSRCQLSDSSPADCRSPLSLVHTESRDRILVSDWSVVLTAASWLSEEGAAGPGVAILTQSKLHSIDQWTLATVSTTTYCQPGDLTRSVSYQVQEETTLLWNVKIKKESCWNTFQRESNNLYPDIEVKKLMDWVICVSDRWTGSSDVFTHCLQSSDKIYQTNILTAWPELFICCWTRLLPSKFCLINNLNTLSNMILSN